MSSKVIFLFISQNECVTSGESFKPLAISLSFSIKENDNISTVWKMHCLCNQLSLYNALYSYGFVPLQYLGEKFYSFYWHKAKEEFSGVAN